MPEWLFGSGVLISALSFDLMAGAYRRGGFDSTSAGFLGASCAGRAALTMIFTVGVSDLSVVADEHRLPYVVPSFEFLDHKRRHLTV
jgi:hypothetical protein